MESYITHALQCFPNAALEVLRARFEAAGYVEEAIRSTLRLTDLSRVNYALAPYYLQEFLVPGVDLHTAIRLFFLAQAADGKSTRALLGDTCLTALAKDGLLMETAPDEWFSSIGLYPCRGLLFATDRPILLIDTPEATMNLQGDSYMLARAQFSQPAERVLDLCTGSGVQGLVASSYAKRLLLVDINRRPLRFAAFNARLNGISNVRFQQGDIYAAAGPIPYDRILANPPYVPTPDELPAYRGGGDDGESVLRRIVQGLEAHLRPGGTAQIVTSFSIRDEDYGETVARWLPLRGFEGLVVSCESFPLERYIAGHLVNLTPDEFDKGLKRWGQHYREAGIVRADYGLMLFHRLKTDRPTRVKWRVLHAVRDLDEGYFHQWLEGRRMAAGLLEGDAPGEAVCPSTGPAVDTVWRAPGRHRVAYKNAAWQADICLEGWSSRLFEELLAGRCLRDAADQAGCTLEAAVERTAWMLEEGIVRLDPR